MAIKRLTIDGYGQIELNNVAFRRDGRIEAQAKPNATDFSVDKLENGMLLAVDAAKREVKYAVDGTLPVALNYSAEHIYDERTPGLKDFALDGTGDFLPRLGYLAVGDKFTTNCIIIAMTYIASVLLAYFWKGVGFVFQKANAVKINFKHFGVSGEKQ